MINPNAPGRVQETPLRRPFAPSDRKLASAWIRDLKTGAAVRRCLVSGDVVAFVFESHAGGWSWIARDFGHVTLRLTAVDVADGELLEAGYVLVDVRGGCEIEREP